MIWLIFSSRMRLCGQVCDLTKPPISIWKCEQEPSTCHFMKAAHNLQLLRHLYWLTTLSNPPQIHIQYCCHFLPWSSKNLTYCYCSLKRLHLQYGLMSEFTQLWHSIAMQFLLESTLVRASTSQQPDVLGGQFSSGVTWAVRGSGRQGSPSNSLSL